MVHLVQPVQVTCKFVWTCQLWLLITSLVINRFWFRKKLWKASDLYYKQVIFTSRKISRISRYSRNSRKFPARENLLFYSILIISVINDCKLLSSYLFLRIVHGQFIMLTDYNVKAPPPQCKTMTWSLILSSRYELFSTKCLVSLDSRS